MIPYYSNINWDFFKKTTYIINISNNINLDDIYYNNISLQNFFYTENANFTKIKKINDKKCILINCILNLYIII